MILRNRRSARRAAAAVTGLLLSALLLGCGASAGSQAPSTPAAAASDDGAAASDAGGGPIGGDIGDRSKGSVQAQISGGMTSSIDLPFGAPAARFLADGPGTAYLPYTDPANGTMFLTITNGELAIQYGGPNDVALMNGGTPCDLKVDTLEATGAKGSFTCKGLMLIHGGSVGSADITGTFEGHQ